MSGKPNCAARSIKGHERPDPNIGPPTASAFSRTDNQCFVDPLRPTSRGSYEDERASARADSALSPEPHRAAADERPSSRPPCIQ